MRIRTHGWPLTIVAVASITRVIPTLLAGFIGTVMTGILLMGLVVRVHQLLTGHGGRAGRDHGARERQVRLTVRRLAEGVPEVSAPELPADPDPAISMEDQ